MAENDNLAHDHAHHEHSGKTLIEAARAALTGSTISPGIFEVAAVLGRDETLGRLDDASGAHRPA